MGCSVGEPKKKKEEKKEEKSRVMQHDKAELELQVQIRRAGDQKKLLEQRVNNFKEEAIKWKKSGNKSKALFALKMKKLAEGGSTNLMA